MRFDYLQNPSIKSHSNVIIVTNMGCFAKGTSAILLEEGIVWILSCSARRPRAMMVPFSGLYTYPSKAG